VEDQLPDLRFTHHGAVSKLELLDPLELKVGAIDLLVDPEDLSRDYDGDD